MLRHCCLLPCVSTIPACAGAKSSRRWDCCRRGEDPEADAAEKALLRTARRGVVRLFNAVAKAQKQASEQQAPGSRARVQPLPPFAFLRVHMSHGGWMSLRLAGET